MKKVTLSKKEIKGLNQKILEYCGKESFFDKKDLVVLVEDKVILKNGEPVFFYEGELLVPSLKVILKDNFLKKITVDMGAIKFVVNGADIMRPGITEIEDGIVEGQIISIIDETHGKPLAIGQAKLDTAGLKAADSGNVIRNIHRVGDEIWNFSA